MGVELVQRPAMRDDYCDGLGDCLPNCPVDAIHFVEREAAAYDAEAVKQNMLKKQQEEAGKQNAGEGPKAPVKSFAGGCPGTRMRMMNREESMQNAESEEEGRETAKSVNKSMLSQWPVQIKLAPVNAPYFDGRSFWSLRIAVPMLMEIFTIVLSKGM